MLNWLLLHEHKLFPSGFTDTLKQPYEVNIEKAGHGHSSPHVTEAIVFSPSEIMVVRSLSPEIIVLRMCGVNFRLEILI